MFVSGTAVGNRNSDVRTAFLFQTTALVLVSLFGSGINSLVALVFYRRPALRSPSNRFVLSLIAANLLASVVVIPVVLIQLVYSDIIINAPWLRQTAQGLSTLAVTAAVFSVLTIAVDRYNAVLSPLHYSMTITRQRSRAMIACAWLVAALLALRHSLGPHSEFPSCERGQLFRVAYTLVLVSLGFTLPLFALCWIYARLYNAAHANSERTRRHSITTSLELPSSPPPTTTLTETPRRTGKNPPLALTSSRRRASNASFSTLLFREEGRAVKTAMMVIASYIFCWTPYFAALLADAWDDELPPVPEPVRFVALLAAFSSGCITPFIYVFRNEAARREAIKLLLWWRGGKYGSNVTRDFETFSAKSASISLPQMTAEAPAIRRQSLSYCDSVSVQSLHIPSECRHCTEPAPAQPTADFVATYEVVVSPIEGSPKTSSSHHDSKGDDDKPSRTRRESVTFRLALLPQRRCQTCVRQNSDSSTSSGHPLIDNETPPLMSAVAARRAQLRRQGSSSGDEPGTPRARVHSAEEDRRSNSTVILELDEQIRSAGIPRTAAVFQVNIPFSLHSI